jgi:uncharacterized membrane protein
MDARAQALRIEPRWPAILAVLSLLLLLAALPDRVRAFPVWAPFVFGIIQIVPMASVTLTGAAERWRRAERIIIVILFGVAGTGTFLNLAHLIDAIVGRSGEIGGIELLTSSITIWVNNVLSFSLLYWQIDRGGPEARANNGNPKPDWLFPQEGVPQQAPADWRPTFVDYLFLGYSTATAFSTTDVMPLTSRAKLLMMLESAISLVTIVAVVSRAINILGS